MVFHMFKFILGTLFKFFQFRSQLDWRDSGVCLWLLLSNLHPSTISFAYMVFLTQNNHSLFQHLPCLTKTPLKSMLPMPVPRFASKCCLDFITCLKHLHLFNTFFLTNWWICQWMNFNPETQKQILSLQKGRAAALEGRTQKLWAQTVLRHFPFERNSTAWARNGSESRSNVLWNHKITPHFKTPCFKATVCCLQFQIPKPCGPANVDLQMTCRPLIPSDSRVAA